VSQLQSKQIECEALLHAICESDASPWCFVELGSDDVQWQSAAFRKLHGTGRPREPVTNADDETLSVTPSLSALIAHMQSDTHITINDQDWSVQNVVVLDNCGHPVGRLIRLTPVEAILNNKTMMLASQDAQRRLAVLSPRESEILDLVYEGLTNKAIAARTNISEKTVEKHRGRVTKKLRTSSLAELVRLVAVARCMDSAASDVNDSDGIC
jgi:DNA-binding CsgD family transcriptional regulator